MEALFWLDAVPAWSASSALTAAVIWDLLLGEFPARLHPVVWLGGAIDRLLPLVPRGRPARELAGGLLLTAFVCVGAWIAAASLLVATASYPVVQWLLCLFLLKSAFSMRALGGAAEGVRKALLAGDLESARSGLRSLCSRDAGRLDARQLAAATVESVAENTSDSVVAPLFWFVVAGVPGAVFYRAANTLDAMIGYRGQLEFVGKTAARLDDVLNWLPARLTALLLFAGGLVSGKASANAARIVARDSRKTASPNAGWPMSMMAGLLGVSLEKQGEYSLGDPAGPADHETIVASWRIAAKAMGLAVLAAVCFVGFLGDLRSRARQPLLRPSFGTDWNCAYAIGRKPSRAVRPDASLGSAAPWGATTGMLPNRWRTTTAYRSRRCASGRRAGEARRSRTRRRWVTTTSKRILGI